MGDTSSVEMGVNCGNGGRGGSGGSCDNGGDGLNVFALGIEVLLLLRLGMVGACVCIFWGSFIRIDSLGESSPVSSFLTGSFAEFDWLLSSPLVSCISSPLICNSFSLI